MRTCRRSSRRGSAAFALGASLALFHATGCILANPAYDAPSTSGGSDSDTGGSATTGGSMTIGDTVGEQCESELCLYLDPPPIACYEFEEDSDMLLDERGCGRDGSISGVTKVPGVHGSGIRVADTSAITVPGGVWPNLPSLTITAWIAIPADKSVDALLFRKEGHFDISLKAPPDPMKNWKLTCVVGDNTLSAEYPVLSANGAWNMISCGCVAPPDNPALCASIFSSVNVAFNPGDDSNISKPEENDATLEIAPDFDGCVDSVQVWSRALTDAELVALYNFGKDMMPSPCGG